MIPVGATGGSETKMVIESHADGPHEFSHQT